MSEPYQLLPFRFARFNSEEYLLTNEVGEFAFIANDVFDDLVNFRINPKSEQFLDLQSKQIATTDNTDDVVKMLAVKYRTKKSPLKDFTCLHMVVPTLRCNSRCIYCQVAAHNMNAEGYDMTKTTAQNTVKTILSCPSPNITIEFQGGDPSTYFEMVKYIIEETETQNILKKKRISFVICTNIILLTDKMIMYLKKHKVQVSTSLDGPADLHNQNRPLQDRTNTHEQFELKLKQIRSICGEDSVSALMTTSKYSLGRFKEIVDEYIRLGFHNIFLRALNPYGFAKQYQDKISYDISDFIDNYKEGLDYIIEINKKGIYFVEGYAGLLLRRILTPFATGFVDLQSPAGVGIAGAIYDWDGNVYVADEGRMLARFKNYYFQLGNVNKDSYQSMFNGEKLHNIIKDSCTECLPMCADCVFEPYCGADPVRNYSEQGDIVGHRPTSNMCKKNRAIITYLFELIKKDDPQINKIFWSWINQY